MSEMFSILSFVITISEFSITVPSPMCAVALISANLSFLGCEKPAAHARRKNNIAALCFIIYVPLSPQRFLQSYYNDTSAVAYATALPLWLLCFFQPAVWQ